MRSVKSALSLLVILALVFSLFTMGSITAASEETPLLGDANGNGKINTTDARVVLLYAAGLPIKETFVPDASDVNLDGKINTTDARLILQFISYPPLDFQ